MNPTKSRNIYLAIIAISVLIIGSTLYHFYGLLGGFEETNVIRGGAVTRKVAGMHFKGNVQSNAYEAIRKTCEQQISQNKLKGYFTEITFQNDSLKSNETDQFIGITLSSGMVEIPYDFEVREFSTTSRYVIPLGIHPLVRKPAHKYEKMIIQQADRDGKQLEPYFMAIHYSKDSLVVEGWVAD